ncbi:MAG: YCF48-related protein, partial [Cyanobacteria bacterium P01_F01_bin.42]
MKSLRQIFILLAVSLVLFGCSSPPALENNPWKVVSLPTDATMVDIGFTRDPSHGWVVGNASSLLETLDGGDTWQERSLDLDNDKYVFTSISFFEDEGWAVGQPNILLHTTDGGSQWEEIPLSERLPGQPTTITALDERSAEMSTDVGAIYRTMDSGQNWKAMVEGAVGVVRN